MNHQERKLLKRQEAKQAVYQMTALQIEQMKKDAYQKAYDKAWEDYNSRIEDIKREATGVACKAVAVIPLVVAHDKWGFGGIRLRRLLDYMMTWINAIQDDPGTLKELQELAEEYSGIRLYEEGEDVPENTTGT